MSLLQASLFDESILLSILSYMYATPICSTAVSDRSAVDLVQIQDLHRRSLYRIL